jgi:hypothetical protein
MIWRKYSKADVIEPIYPHQTKEEEMCIAFPKVASTSKQPWYKTFFTFVSFLFTFFIGLLKGLLAKIGITT